MSALVRSADPGQTRGDRNAALPVANLGLTSVVGVLGGMGPLASAEFLRLLALDTPTSTESDHVHTLTWSNPRIPDRTAALLEGGGSPVCAMQKGVDVLAAGGAELLVIPCNTAHAFVDRLSLPPGMRLVSMIDATTRMVAGRLGRVSPPARVGLLATRGTRASRLYDDGFRRVGIRTLHVSEHVQEACIDRAIAEVKVGNCSDTTEALVTRACEELLASGADAVVGGCTELSLVACGARQRCLFVDTLECLAHEVLRLLLHLEPPDRSSRTAD